MNATPPTEVQADDTQNERRAFRTPFWVTAVTLMTAGFIALGCTSNDGFPVPYAKGEVLRSGLSIPPGQTFLLGGGQPGEFIVQAYNEGDVAVEISADPEDNRFKASTAYPESMIEATFKPGQTALLTNTSDETTAKLKVTITSLERGQQLGMRYIDR
ncbi:MAG: hypothetical protein AAGF84_12895 [Planctomycetota bacterium]